MARASGFRELKVWQKAVDLVAKVYSVTRSYPTDERYGLVSQLRRSAVSVAANIAEGSGRWTKGEYVNCLSVSSGSAKEVETLAEVSRRLEFLAESDHGQITSDAIEISQMIHGLQKRLRKSR